MKLFSVIFANVLHEAMVGAFIHVPFSVTRYGANSSQLHAENGAPQYEKLNAVLREAKEVGKDSFMLYMNTEEENDYKPGHVLALEIEDINKESTGKTAEDAEKNAGWMRGPYTVSRASEDSIDILVKVVGEKSKAFANAEPGTPLKYGGKFKVPIIDGIDKEKTKHVVLISTGVGVGPCIGAIEEGLKDATFPSIQLCASFRKQEDVVCEDHLTELAEKNPDKFTWNAIITAECGKISANEEHIKAAMFSRFGDFTTDDVHYHLIGNGQMVNEWKAGLARAGVPEEKVTLEMYFNHKGEADETRVSAIANAVSAAFVSPVLN